MELIDKSSIILSLASLTPKEIFMCFLPGILLFSFLLLMFITICFIFKKYRKRRDRREDEQGHYSALYDTDEEDGYQRQWAQNYRKQRPSPPLARKPPSLKRPLSSEKHMRPVPPPPPPRPPKPPPPPAPPLPAALRLLPQNPPESSRSQTMFQTPVPSRRASNLPSRRPPRVPPPPPPPPPPPSPLLFSQSSPMPTSSAQIPAGQLVEGYKHLKKIHRQSGVPMSKRRKSSARKRLGNSFMDEVKKKVLERGKLMQSIYDVESSSSSLRSMY